MKVVCCFWCAVEVAILFAVPTGIEKMFGTMFSICTAFLIGNIVYYGWSKTMGVLRKHKKETWICALCIVFAFGLIVYSLKDHTIASVFGQFILLLQILMLPMMFFGLFGIYVWNWETWKIYLLIGTLIGIAYMLMIPVGAVPDEIVHSRSAYYVSNLILGIKSPSGSILMRADDVALLKTNYGRMSYFDAQGFETYLTQLISPLKDGSLVNMDNVVIPPLYCYFLSGAGIALGRLLCLNTYAVLMIGRLFNFVFYMLLTTYAVKKIPFGKLTMVVLLLMPVTIQQGMSYSYDVFTNAFSVILMAYVMEIAMKKESPLLSRKEYIILAVASIGLVLIKSGAYFLLSLLPWIMLAYKKYPLSENVAKNFKKAILIIVILFVGVYIGWAMTGAKTYQYTLAPFREEGQHYYSIGYFLGNPLAIFPIFMTTLISMSSYYCSTFVGEYLAWLDLLIPKVVVTLYYILLFFASIKRADEDYVVPEKLKKVFLFLFLFTSLFIFAGLLLSWSSVEGGYIQGIQGRYFIPIAMPLCMLLGSRKLQIDSHADKSVMVTLLACVLFVGEYLLIRL